MKIPGRYIRLVKICLNGLKGGIKPSSLQRSHLFNPIPEIVYAFYPPGGGFNSKRGEDIIMKNP